MLHAASMLVGFALIWTFVSAGSAPMALSLGAGLICMLWGARFGGVWRGFGRAPMIAIALIAESGTTLRGVWRVMRGTAASRLNIKPALIRIRRRSSGAFARALFANAIGAAPGRLVIDDGDDGVLVHVIDESKVNDDALERLQARMSRAAGEAA